MRPAAPLYGSSRVVRYLLGLEWTTHCGHATFIHSSLKFHVRGGKGRRNT
jgi:hypothetical protein